MVLPVLYSSEILVAVAVIVGGYLAEMAPQYGVFYMLVDLSSPSPT